MLIRSLPLEFGGARTRLTPLKHRRFPRIEQPGLTIPCPALGTSVTHIRHSSRHARFVSRFYLGQRLFELFQHVTL